MMFRYLPAIILILMVTVSGCARAVPLWRDEAKSVMIAVYFKGAQKEFPVEYGSAFDTLKRGEDLLHEDEVQEADDFYRLAWTKGKVLEKDLAELKARREEEARLKAEAERREAERLRALKEEQDRIARQRKDAEVRTRKASEKSHQARERQLPDSHTVKRGETLPQIAAQSDVYNDYRLWPLLYRANRDQIRDPKHIWPGQVLRIPRTLSREEISEARRYAQEKPIH